MGPMDYSTHYPLGLVDRRFRHAAAGADDQPNRAINAPLLESWGLAKVKDVYGLVVLRPERHGQPLAAA